MTGTSKITLLATAAAIILGTGLGAQLRAETIVVDGRVAVQKSDIPRPAAGMTMDAVQARFGAPLAQHPTVGKPPITRWDYSQFVVVFEKNRVIDAVVIPSPSDQAAPQPAAAPPVAAEPAAAAPPAPAPTAASEPAGALHPAAPPHSDGSVPAAS